MSNSTKILHDRCTDCHHDRPWNTICATYLKKVIQTQEDLLPVKVVLPFPRIIAKGIKYIMLATVTGCAIQSTLILTKLAERVL